MRNKPSGWNQRLCTLISAVRTVSVLGLLLASFPGFNGKVLASARDYEAFYLKIGSFPDDKQHDWNPALTEIQGVTHDDEGNWYFTSAAYEISFLTPEVINGVLRRIPVSLSLDQDVNGLPGVARTSMFHWPALQAANYRHWGDLDFHRNDGQGYLVVPVTAGTVAPTCVNSSDCPATQECMCFPLIGCSCYCASDADCPLGTCSDGHCKADPAIAFFRSDDLSFVNYEILPGQKSVGWCAVSPTGELFSSNDDLGCSTDEPTVCTDQTARDNRYTLRRYGINWSQLADTSRHDALTWMQSYPLRDPVSGAPLFFHNMQGGEFTPSGRLLYLSSGSGRCHGHGAGNFNEDGLHVFDRTTWREVQRSTNHSRSDDYVCSLDRSTACPGVFPYESCGRCTLDPTQIVTCENGNSNSCPEFPVGLGLHPCNEDRTLGTCESGYFDYSYEIGCTCSFIGLGSQTPEGLTIWDLDDPIVRDQFHVDSNLHGQLHVLLDFFNMPVEACDDALSLQHFGKVHVDATGFPADWTNPLTGTEERPFQHVKDAFEFYPIWDGAEIVIQAGSYPDTGRFSTRVRLVSRGGVVTIGR